MTELPGPVEAVCGTFLGALPAGLISGLYLHGGLAFGEWVPGKSDIDFLATLARDPGPDDVAALRAAHEAVAARAEDSPSFDGVHVLASDLARHPDECPDRPAVFQHGFEAVGRFTLSPVPWHELAHHGVTVAGPLIVRVRSPVSRV